MIEAILTTKSTGIAGMECKLVFESVNRSIVDNTSVLQLKKVYFKRPTTGQTLMTGTTEIRVGGVLIYTIPWRGASIYPETAGQWNAITGSGAPDAEGRVVKTGTLEHEADGTLSLAVTVSGGFTWDEYNYSEVIYHEAGFQAEGTVTAERIARKSSMTLMDGELGQNAIVSINRQSDQARHTLTWSCGSASGTVADKSADVSFTVTMPVSLSAQNTSGDSVTINWVLETFFDGTSVGTVTGQTAMQIPASVVPVISAVSVADAMGYAAVYGRYVQSRSKPSVSITAAGAQGSTIAQYTIIFEGKTYEGNQKTLDIIKGSGKLTIRCSVTDSRGRTADQTQDINCYAYTAPSASSFAAYRCDSQGNENDQGAYIKITGSGTYTELGGNNTMTVTGAVKSKTGSSWTSASMTENGVILQADVLLAYTARLQVADNFQTIEITTDIGTVYATMDFAPGGKGIAFGGMADNEGFRCDMAAKFMAGVMIGNQTLEEYIRTVIG